MSWSKITDPNYVRIWNKYLEDKKNDFKNI